MLITDSENDKDDSILIVEEHQTIRRKNDRSQINKSLSKKKRKTEDESSSKKRKTEQYKADFGSDFEDNFETESSSEDEDEEDGQEARQSSSITLNLTSSNKPDTSRKGIESIIGCSLSRIRSKSVPDIPSHWTQEMDSFYNRVNEVSSDWSSFIGRESKV